MPLALAIVFLGLIFFAGWHALACKELCLSPGFCCMDRLFGLKAWFILCSLGNFLGCGRPGQPSSACEQQLKA